MKAFLVFNRPNDEQEFRVASTAMAWYLTVWDLDQWLRGEIKYQVLFHPTPMLGLSQLGILLGLFLLADALFSFSWFTLFSF